MEWHLLENIKPKNRQDVIVCFTNKYKKTLITIATFIEEKTVLADDFLDEDVEGFSEYDDEKDCYWTPKGFYEQQYSADLNYFLDENITHWMELPKLPIV